ncbi:MAG: SAM-dependent chlorinase/fluorinase, partial [Armatimonadetes bacterium]|nr:SAM-dependent chlorinase/fluorinase [Armatimonadota bacterium]
MTDRLKQSIRPAVTLTTDFGRRDPYVGAMKGVLLQRAPGSQLIDISHDIDPGDIRSAAYILAAAAPYYPVGTVHVVVVDPGVGTSRRALAAGDGHGWFVAPDNGVLSL